MVAREVKSLALDDLWSFNINFERSLDMVIMLLNLSHKFMDPNPKNRLLPVQAKGCIHLSLIELAM